MEWMILSTVGLGTGRLFGSAAAAVVLVLFAVATTLILRRTSNAGRS